MVNLRIFMGTMGLEFYTTEVGKKLKYRMGIPVIVGNWADLSICNGIWVFKSL